MGLTIVEVAGAPPGGAGPPLENAPTTTDHAISDMTSAGLARARILILFVGYLIIGAAAGGIFDRFQWVLIAAPVLPTISACLLVGRSGTTRAVGAGIAVVTSVGLGVVAADGSSADITDAFTAGIQGLLSTDWPSPNSADLVGAVVAVTATATALSAELATRTRFHVLPLLPILLCYLGVIGLSSPLGARWTWLILLGVVAVVFAMFRNEGTLHDRVVLLRGERRVIPLLLVTGVIVALVAVPLSLTTRADPRRNDPAQTTAPLLDPIEATLALRNIDPPIDLHHVTPRAGQSLPVRWRTAALEDYDGRRWSPTLTLRPIGATLGPARGPVIDADVSFLDSNLSLVPLPGDPVSVEAAVETDAERTVVRLIDAPEPGDTVRVIANEAPSMDDTNEVGIVPRLVEESASTLDDLAEALAGDAPPISQLRQLESVLRNEFTLDSDVQGGGLQQALIDRFLRDTRRGTPEQFVTAYVLLARSLGIEARVATGFVADGPADDPSPLPTPGERITLSSVDAQVWPEVLLTDGRWLAFDPVPEAEANDGAPPPPDPQAQTPAAPQPPVVPAPEPETDSPEIDDAVDEPQTSTLSTVIVWALRGTLMVSLLLLPIAAAGALVAGIKYRRRRRRLRARSPSGRICGAWACATDALVDAGLEIAVSATDGEIATAAGPLVVDARRDLRRLAALASAAAYGSPERPELLAEDATRCLNSVEESLAGVRTRWQRLRWRLSLRSLRPSTRSPVVA